MGNVERIMISCASDRSEALGKYGEERMNMKSKNRRVKGFTLVELLVVISIIALLLAIVLPAINQALLRGRALRTTSDARTIWQGIMLKETDDIYISTAAAFPDGQAHTREYFADLVTNGILNVAWSFFAAPGIQAATTEEEFRTGPQHNAWRVVDQSANIPETAPLIMTRNLTEYDALDGQPLIPGGLTLAPFGDRAFIFVTRGGAGFGLSGDQLVQGQFDQLFITVDHKGQAVGNAILAY